MDALPSDWKIVMLGHCAERKGKVYKTLETPARNITIHYSVHPFCGHAYMIKYHTAEELLKILEHHGWSGHHHFDLTFGRFIGKHKHNSFSIWSPIVMQREAGVTNNKHHNGFYDLPKGFESLHKVVSDKDYQVEV